MDLSPRTSIFGPYEFAVRRLHSLIGLMPIGAYLGVHLLTNGSILDGPATYQARVDQIHALGETTLFFVEWTFIFLPILFHGLIGLLIVGRGERNLPHYPYPGNFRYTLQRISGVVAFVFIIWHVFQMHGWFRLHWWHEYVARPLGGAQFDPAHAAVTAALAIRSSPIMMGIYVVGILASVYHLANGLWTMGITWGLWTAPRAQRWANLPCALVGLVLAAAGLGSLCGFDRLPLPQSPAAKQSATPLSQAAPPRHGNL